MIHPVCFAAAKVVHSRHAGGEDKKSSGSSSSDESSGVCFPGLFLIGQGLPSAGDWLKNMVLPWIDDGCSTGQRHGSPRTWRPPRDYTCDGVCAHCTERATSSHRACSCHQQGLFYMPPKDLNSLEPLVRCCRSELTSCALSCMRPLQAPYTNVKPEMS